MNPNYCFNYAIYLDAYPWPAILIGCTGFLPSEIQSCCLKIYEYCLTGKHLVMDRRSVKLEAVIIRYKSEEFGCISEHSFQSYKQLISSPVWNQVHYS